MTRSLPLNNLRILRAVCVSRSSSVCWYFHSTSQRQLQWHCCRRTMIASLGSIFKDPKWSASSLFASWMCFCLSLPGPHPRRPMSVHSSSASWLLGCLSQWEAPVGGAGGQVGALSPCSLPALGLVTASSLTTAPTEKPFLHSFQVPWAWVILFLAVSLALGVPLFVLLILVTSLNRAPSLKLFPSELSRAISLPARPCLIQWICITLNEQSSNVCSYQTEGTKPT